MRRSIVLVAAVVSFALAAAAADAMYSVANEGRWPKSWPAELEPLRKQSRTLAGPTVEALHYQIPFEKREQFEAAWPHLLKVKTKGAPIFLRRSPDASLGITIKAGVVVHTPPANTDTRANPEAPLPGRPDMPGRWMWTNWIE